MRFNGELNEVALKKVKSGDSALTDPKRLEALKRTGLMNTPSEAAFDRLAALAAKILKAPLTIVSLVSDQKQFFKASYGMPSPFDVSREIPIDGSICRYTLQGGPIIAGDASNDPLLKFHPTTAPWGIGAFIALPMITHTGHVLGAFCAVHPVTHKWTDEEIEVMRELTASIMTEIQLREEISSLQLERELRERFVTTLTHDLRTPLTAAKMGAQLLARKTIDANQSQIMLGRISDNIDRADHMIRDLLDASRIKAGEGVPLQLSSLNLNELIQTSLEDFITIHGNRFMTKAAEQVVGEWDADALRRMVENLIGNAIKYGLSQSVVTVTIQKLEKSVEISVHNLGNPISENDQRRLFDPYHRTADAANSKQKGWGIGLTLVQGFAEAHGGQASVVSSTEEGTTFTITLPLTGKNG